MRLNNVPFRLFVGSLVLFLTVSVFPAHAQQSENAKQLKDLVQTPVAVDKAVKNGADPDEMRTLARELNVGGVNSNDFNETMRHGPEISEKMNKDQIGQFVKQKKENGLRGKELANSIHKELRSRGIPAGGNNAKGPPPVARDYIPEHAKKKMKNKRGGPSDSAKKGRSKAGDRKEDGMERGKDAREGKQEKSEQARDRQQEDREDASEQRERGNDNQEMRNNQQSDKGSSNRGGSSSNRGGGR